MVTQSSWSRLCEPTLRQKEGEGWGTLGLGKFRVGHPPGLRLRFQMQDLDTFQTLIKYHPSDRDN